ncbi:Kinesin heavy chain [Fusarium oxysporum f. sp. albedinis]|nr:Kinesin heavy chain [Fusarium oxysporum f. sp. albedinis]
MSIDAFPFLDISGSLFVPCFATEEPVVGETPGFCSKHGLWNQAAVVNLRSIDLINTDSEPLYHKGRSSKTAGDLQSIILYLSSGSRKVSDFRGGRQNKPSQESPKFRLNYLNLFVAWD